MRPYPETVPPEALSIVLAAFQGQPVDKAEAFHAAYETAGFAIGKLFPHNSVPIFGVVVSDVIPVDEVSRAESVPEIEAAFTSAMDTLTGPGEIDGVAVWSLSPMVIRLLLKAAVAVLQRVLA